MLTARNCIVQRTRFWQHYVGTVPEIAFMTVLHLDLLLQITE